MNFIKWFFSLWKGKKEIPQSYDFEKEKREISELDAKFSEIFGDAYFGSGASKDWRPSLPQLEIQGFGDCTCFSRLNCAELKAKYEGVKDDDGNEFNFSDLDLAVGSQTKRTGNSLKAVAEYGRRIGVSLEKDCPYTYIWEERNARYNAAKNKKKYKLGNWSWVNCNNNSLKNALESGPVQIGIGVGRNYNSSGIIKDPKYYQCYHAITLVYMDEIGNKYIFDHYSLSQKILEAGYNVYFAMVFADLPSDWRGKCSDDSLFYKRMIGKLILLPEADGQVFRIEENCLRKVNFIVTDKKLWDIMQVIFREKKVFLGVSNKDFERLKKVAFETGEGIVSEDEIIDITSILNNLII